MRVITVVIKASCLLCFSGVLHSAQGVESKARVVSDSAGQPSTTILAAGMDGLELKRRSLLWYVLSRDNGSGLLQGLPQRLGKVIVPSRRKDPVWQGVDGGGSVKLVIERDSDAEGEIFVGFFAGPRWWLAEPVQARIFDEPGDRLVFVVDRLPPGEYWIGAMVGGLPTPKALGVHRTWPAPITVGAGKANAELRISTKFSEVSASGRLADYRGKVVWLNVFGTGCAPCLEEWPRLVELSQQYGAEGLAVLAICPQPAKEVEEFARLRSPPFPVLVDEHQEAVARIINPGRLVLPSNLLIDRDGRIAHLSEDFTDEEFAELTAKARKLLTREP